MALEVTTGFTEDGLVFLRFVGQQEQFGKPIQSIVTMEPDQAQQIGQRLVDDSKKAKTACNRPIIVGQQQTFKRG
ncbi:MAG: hypothetical protein P8012_00170 [Desulfobacterales bacterium]|jgi:hypothetical protein